MTNVICAAKVTNSNEADSNHFAPLVETAAKHSDLGEVLADAAYLSRENLQTVVDHGATPYIAWKANSRETDKPNNELWNRMYHLFALNRREFLAKYGQRSNCETTFSMIKSKFGSVLRSKTETAQINEALAKCLCHNICCLISAIFELGVEPEFYQA